MDQDTIDAKDQQEAQAAFDAAFSEEAAKEPEKKPAPEPAKEVETPPAEPPITETKQPDAKAPELTAEEIDALRATAREVPALKEQLRSFQGRLGAAVDLLDKLRAEKKAEGKAAEATPLELKQLKAAYPELADAISADLGESLRALRQTNPEEVSELVTKRLTEEMAKQNEERLRERTEERREVVRSVHPDFDETVASPAFGAWLKSHATAEQREVAANGDRPAPVIGLVAAYKKWTAEQAKPKPNTKERLEAAITPEGEKRPAGKSTMSDEEAMAKGFEAGFNT